jgi:two-component system sensor histidine kinase/response regulator
VAADGGVMSPYHLPDMPERSPAVLIVDDNPAKRLGLRAALKPLGYDIVEAGSGVAALRCVTARDFAVILLDVRMPNMDGFETAAHIRKRQQSEMTPIIFITAHAKNEVLNSDLYVEGAVDVIFPPVSPSELRAKVSVFANLFIRAEELAHRAREVEESAAHLRFLFDAAPIGIFQTDSQNRYVYTNPRWTEITGLTADEASGRRWDTILDKQVRGRLVAELPYGEIDWLYLRQRFEIHPPGSVARIVLVTLKAVPDEHGETTGWVGTLSDVTSEAGAEAALSEARDKATEASRLKSDFLANMSHEIRTPMNGVIGMTDLLLETDLDARQHDYAQTVRNSGEALLTIIDDILDFSKVEAGMLEVEDIEFILRDVVNDVVDLLAGSAQAKGLELISVFDSAVPAVISGDPGRTRQVLTNLIGNAIKFTQAGEIVVRVDEADVPGPDTVIRFDVSDTGDGIAPGKLDLIFQPFVQADTSDSRRYGGTGLGLAISSQLVALMGGACGVHSQPGEGSNFWFTIRVRTVTQSEDLPPVDPGLAGVAVLIVDDSSIQCSVMSEHLTDWGMAVTTAKSGDVALATLRTAVDDGLPFAVVLLDQSLPLVDGLDVKSAILADPSVDPHVVLMTGLGQGRRRGDVAESGVWATLSKPIHREELQACLRVALGLPAGDLATGRRPASALHGPAKEVVGRLLLAEDNPINQKVAVAMLSSAGYRVDTVCNGAEAVQAVAVRPYDVILMDCQMPELNGYEATAAIRASEGTGRHTPIIAMTAGARQEDRERCLAEGMDSYLPKPVNKDVLLALVGRYVGSAA